MSEATQSPVALTIAGSDPSGGAGLQADLKTFHRWGCYGASVVTLLTVQNTLGVLAVESMPVELVLAQYRAVTDDFTVDAIKTGALGNADLITAISTELATQNASVIVDPVMISKHGDRLIEDDAVAALREQLIPTATLITPNRFEAETLSGIKIDSPKSLLRAANLLMALGTDAVLIKAHFEDQNRNLLMLENDHITFQSPRIKTQSTHGSGCVLSAAIAAQLAHGSGLKQAVSDSLQWLQRTIATAPRIGRGFGPLNLLD